MNLFNEPYPKPANLCQYSRPISGGNERGTTCQKLFLTRQHFRLGRSSGTFVLGSNTGYAHHDLRRYLMPGSLAGPASYLSCQP